MSTSGGESEPTTNDGEAEAPKGAADDGANENEDDGSLIKKRVRYRLLRELGQRTQRTYAAMRSEGGGSTLVVAQRFSLGGHVDEERVASSDALRAIAHEALLLKKNWHPNIARIRHVDTIDDSVFVATDFLDGVTLEEFLALANAKSLTLHPEEPMISHAVVARVFLDVLAGLSALHALREDGASAPLGAYHGALCPANIVIGKDGVARIVATFRQRPPRVTPKSESLGYASPEIFARTADSSQEVDLKSDLFAVGVMLWEALSEKRLYADADPARIAQRQRTDEPPKPNARLADVVSQALAFDPLVRFRTAHDMASSIRSRAGSIATGSALAQLVSDLAGDRIKARRLEIQGGPIGAKAAARKVNPALPTLPRRTQSGSIPRAQAPSAKAEAPPLPAAPPLPPPNAPPKRMTPPPGRVRRLTPRELRAVAPTSNQASSPSVETAAPIIAHAVAPAQPDEDADDSTNDELPGPRPSTPDTAYLNVLRAPGKKASVAPEAAEPAGEELDADDLLLDDADESVASPFIGTNDAIEPEVAEFAREVVISETSVTKDPPSEPSITRPSSALSATPRALDANRSPATPPTGTHSSSRTPFTVDVVRPSSRPRASNALSGRQLSPTMRKALPIVALMAVSIVLLLAGAAIIAGQTPTSSQAAPPNASTSPVVDPPSTVIVAPPPPAVEALPSASASPLKR